MNVELRHVCSEEPFLVKHLSYLILCSYSCSWQHLPSCTHSEQNIGSDSGCHVADVSGKYMKIWGKSTKNLGKYAEHLSKVVVIES